MKADDSIAMMDIGCLSMMREGAFVNYHESAGLSWKLCDQYQMLSGYQTFL